jgi:phosphoserine phosphatase
MALATKARPSVMRAIQRAREFGARVVLASASIDVVVESFAKRLDARGHVATRLEYRAGKATGRILHDCTGRKLADLEAAGLITDAPFDVVTDNAEDVDLLGRAECSTFIGPESE